MASYTEHNSLEEIKEGNAKELSHIINQYQLERKYVLKISHFLNKSNEGDGYTYEKNLNRLKKVLEEIPYSEYFLEYLNSDTSKFSKRAWQRSDPISETPKTHKLHAYYSRVFKKTCFRYVDKDIGRPRPDIFVPEHSILMEHIANKIEHINKLYIMIKPFGYDFPEILEADGMIFKFYELFNPSYVCKKNSWEEPAPIIINGVKKAPMSNTLYTKLYREYLMATVEKSRRLDNSLYAVK